MVCFAVLPRPDERTIAVQRPFAEVVIWRSGRRPSLTRSRHVARSTTWSIPRRRKVIEPRPGAGRQENTAAEATAAASTSEFWLPPLRLSRGDHRGPARDRLRYRDQAGLHPGRRAGRARAPGRVPLYAGALQGHVPRAAVDDPPVRRLRFG